MASGRNAGFAMLVLSSLTVAGCAPHVTQQVQVAVPSTPVRTGPAIPQIYNKTALAGQVTRIDFAFNVNPDCSVRNIPTVRIIDQPVHGTTQVTQTEDFTAFPPQNIHFACNKQKSHGTALDYIASPGYVGGDYLSFEVINADGSDHIFKVALNVK